jgi:triphosphatase
MRVALRRMRAAMSLFSDIVGDAEVDRLKSELKWLTAELAPARELDVLIQGVLRPALDRDRTDRMADVWAQYVRHRAQAFERAGGAVRSTRFQSLVLDCADWIEAGRWTSRQERATPRAHSIKQYARRELTRRHKKIVKKTRKFEELTALQRHKHRIQIKKMRYGVEFLAAAVRGKSATKRRCALLSALKRLQDTLGSLNDATARDELAWKIASEDPGTGGVETSGRRRAYVAGTVIGERNAAVPTLIKRAAEEHEAFREVKPFWK